MNSSNTIQADTIESQEIDKYVELVNEVNVEDVPVRRVVRPNEEMLRQQKYAQAISALVELAGTLSENTGTLRRGINEFVRITHGIKLNGEYDTSDREPDPPTNEWEGRFIHNTTSAEEAASDLIVFSDEKTLPLNVFNSNKAMVAQMIPSTLKKFPFQTLIDILTFGRSVLLGYLAQRYTLLATDDGQIKDFNITVNENGEDVTHSAVLVAKDAQDTFKKLMTRYITKLPEIRPPNLLEYIPENANLLFKPILYTYWRLATYMAAIYRKDQPYQYDYLYKYINVNMFNFFDTSTTESKQSIFPSPQSSRVQFFTQLFPGNPGGLTIGEFFDELI